MGRIIAKNIGTLELKLSSQSLFETEAEVTVSKLKKMGSQSLIETKLITDLQ